MDGVRCGLLTQSDSGDLRFDYDDNYRNETDPTPLSLSMPTATRRLTVSRTTSSPLSPH
ncbi:HipA N-terminal domain-containing protein [Gordonia sp. (in: high G+C Gram-positive bacteria)]|uniref:HipA N-terminal domain-containing protein n=1 Tax=Gordonia sp. (in: high G+C Gram-positive bacteria) TaxID=84139 RepID=UPI0034532DD4